MEMSVKQIDLQEGAVRKLLDPPGMALRDRGLGVGTAIDGRGRVWRSRARRVLAMPARL
jgi:hypothetical protein